MRFFVTAFLAAALAVVTVLPRTASACEYDFEPEEPSGKTGTQLTLVWTITWTHRKCDLDDQDVNITLDNVTVVTKPQWEKVKRMVYEGTIVVQLGHPGQGSVRVWRTCKRENTHGKTATITITP